MGQENPLGNVVRGRDEDNDRVVALHQGEHFRQESQDYNSSNRTNIPDALKAMTQIQIFLHFFCTHRA